MICVDGQAEGLECAAASEVVCGNATGRRLIEGLVSRELRGRFAVSRSVAGGACVAQVEFSLEHDESVDVS
jgi:hypothetical protein